MSPDTASSGVSIDLPAQPAALARLTAMLYRPVCDFREMAGVIEADMALGAAVLHAVNTARFGLAGGVRTVQEAITYLGTRDIAALTLELGLRGLFPQCPELDALWARAAQRGSLMANLAIHLGFDAWVAHSAGLFEECGKAILFRHAPQRYGAILALATDDEELVFLEHSAFEASHDLLGAALCETWGLAPAAIQSVRYHVEVQSRRSVPGHLRQRGIAAVSCLARVITDDPDALEDSVEALGDALSLAVPVACERVRKVQARYLARSAAP